MNYIYAKKKIIEKVIWDSMLFTVCLGTSGYKEVFGRKRMGLVGKCEKY